ncbi:MAG: PRC-barrel domain-containing protein [Bacillaceae bacterium]|nr:PRC-barrel domain-containing protein [Bacillaceae bacterium]
MRTFSSLKGLSVFLLQTGEALGKVHDLELIDNQIVGVIIDKKGWLNHHLSIALPDIDSVGIDAIMIKESQKIDKANKQMCLFATGKKTPSGKNVINNGR